MVCQIEMNDFDFIHNTDRNTYSSKVCWVNVLQRSLFNVKNEVSHSNENLACLVLRKISKTKHCSATKRWTLTHGVSRKSLLLLLLAL